MSVSFDEIRISNFMGFREEVTLPLNNQGLVLIQGRNERSASADVNGVGKTALIDAIAWALYGKTLPRDGVFLQADAVSNRFALDDGEQGAQVTLHFTLDGDLYTLERRRKPNIVQLFKQDEPVADQSDVTGYVESLLGIGYGTFRMAMVFGQGAFERFATADHKDKLRIFDEIQSVNLKAAYDAAVEDRRSLKADLDDIEQELEVRNARIEELESSTHSKEELDKMRATLGTLGLQIRNRQDRKKKAERDESRWAKYVEPIEEKIEKLTEVLGREKVRVKDAERARDRVLERMRDLLEQDACPTCKRPLDTSSEKKRVKAAFEKDDLKEADDRLLELRVKVRELSDAVAEQEGLLAKAMKKYVTPAVFEKELELVRDQAVLERQAVELSKQLDGASKAQQRLKKLRSEAVAYETKREQAQRRLAVVEFWAEAFGDRGIRSEMVVAASAFLNERLAEHLEALTEGECTGSFGLNMKRGRPTLTVEGEWSWGTDVFEQQSNGQHRRFDLATFLALQDLAEQRSTRPFPLRVFDQPEEGLDPRGLELFGEWIQRRSKETGTGLLITHHPLLIDAVTPDQVWTVVMDENGSRVEME